MTPRTRPAGMVISAPPRIPQASAAVAGRLRMAGWLPVAGTAPATGSAALSGPTETSVPPGPGAPAGDPGPGGPAAGRPAPGAPSSGAPSSGGDGMRPGRSVTATAHWLRSAEQQDCFNGITGAPSVSSGPGGGAAGNPLTRAACYRPAAARRFSARSVRSQEKSG